MVQITTKKHSGVDYNDVLYALVCVSWCVCVCVNLTTSRQRIFCSQHLASNRSTGPSLPQIPIFSVTYMTPLHRYCGMSDYIRGLSL